MDHDTVRHFGDNRGRKDGGTSMGVTFLRKSRSLKWKLSESTRIGYLTSTERRSEDEGGKNGIMQTSPIIVQVKLIQYSEFVGKWRLSEALARQP